MSIIEGIQAICTVALTGTAIGTLLVLCAFLGHLKDWLDRH